MTEHTPWRVKMDYVVKGDHEAVDLYRHKPRIVACVNALAGIDDPEALMSVVRKAARQKLISECADGDFESAYDTFIKAARNILKGGA